MNFKKFICEFQEIVNFIHSHSKEHRIVSEVCTDLEADAMSLYNHVEARCVSKGKVLDRVFQLRQELRVFLLIKDTQCPLI